MKKFIISIIVNCLLLILAGCGSSFQNLKSEADTGDARSQYEVGVNYYVGTKDIKIDKELGLEYLKKSANQNYAPAIMELGIISQKNEKYDDAFKYYNEAAIKYNYGPAYGNLALLYEKGYGVQSDINEAIRLLILADKNGDYLAKRNLAIIYKKLKKYNESEKFFKEILLSPPYKNNTNEFKQVICLDLMNINYENNRLIEAYEWGALAIISGVFDSKLDNSENYLKIYNIVSSKLSEDVKKEVAKNIIINHYNMFEKYEYFLVQNPNLQTEDGVIGGRMNIYLVGYEVQKNIEIIQTINYFKTKDDLNAKINVAIGNLKLASSYIKLGVIVPQIGLAISKIKEAKEVLDSVNNENLVSLKNNINAKLIILEDINQYQSKIHEQKREINQ